MIILRIVKPSTSIVIILHGRNMSRLYNGNKRFSDLNTLRGEPCPKVLNTCIPKAQPEVCRLLASTASLHLI